MVEKRIDLACGSMTYLEHGTGVPLILLHGGLATPRAYIPLIELLGQSYRVIAPTHPGHGASFALPKECRFDNFTSAYELLFRALALDKPILIGHSFGGAIALMLASHRLASMLILMDPIGLPIDFSAKNYLRTLLKEGKVMLAGMKKRQQLTEMLSATGTVLYTGVHHPENVSWLQEYGPKLDLAKHLSAIPCRVELLWGADDAIVPLSVGQRMQALIPDSALTVFPGWGHTYMVTEPEETHKVLLNILSKPHVNA